MTGLLRQCNKQEKRSKMIFLISGVISDETEILNYVIFFLSKRVDVCAENTGNVP